MATPTRNQRWSFVSVPSGTIATCTAAAGAVGDWIVAPFIAVGQVPSITDSVGGPGAWTTYGPFGPTGGPRNYSIYIGVSGPITAAARTISASVGGAATQISIGATSYSGCAATNAVDKIVFAFGSGTALNSGPTPVTTFPNEMVIGIGSVDQATNGTWTAGSSGGAYLNDGTAGSGQSAGSPAIGIESRGDSAANAKTADFTFTQTGPWVMICMTLSDTPVPPASAGPDAGDTVLATLGNARGPSLLGPYHTGMFNGFGGNNPFQSFGPPTQPPPQGSSSGTYRRRWHRYN